MSYIFNYPLLSSFLAVVIAQLIKIVLYYMTNRTWNFDLLFSTGGLPSSHSAAVTSLSTAVAIQSGVNSSFFAIAVVFSVIVMFDAAGIRRHAGEQAVVLNRLIEEFQHLVQEMKLMKVKPLQEKRKTLKELLGHQPSEVVVGGVLGIIISLVLYYFFY